MEKERTFFDIESPLETSFKKTLADISEKYYPGTLAKAKEKYPELWQAIKDAELEMERFWIPWNEAFEDWKSLINEAIIVCQNEAPEETT
jgi:hypothetical protein